METLFFTSFIRSEISNVLGDVYKARGDLSRLGGWHEKTKMAASPVRRKMAAGVSLAHLVILRLVNMGERVRGHGVRGHRVRGCGVNS